MPWTVIVSPTGRFLLSRRDTTRVVCFTQSKTWLEILAAMARRQRQVRVPRLRPLSPRQAAPQAREGRPGVARPGRSRGRLTPLVLLTQGWPEKPPRRHKTPQPNSALNVSSAGGNLWDFRWRAPVLAQLYGRCSLKTSAVSGWRLGWGRSWNLDFWPKVRKAFNPSPQWRCAEESADVMMTRSVEIILFSSVSHPPPQLFSICLFFRAFFYSVV